MFEFAKDKNVRLMLDMSKERHTEEEINSIKERFLQIDKKELFDICHEHELDGVVGSFAIKHEKELPEFSLRLQAKAGLTGYAQVYGKYNTTPYDKLQLDLLYIAHPSFLEDLRIIFATVKILFMPKSVEGIDENAITAMENPEEELVEV